MSEEQKKPKKLSLSGSGKLSLGGTGEQPPLRGGAVVGGSRGKTVQVEVRRKRVGGTPVRGRLLLLQQNSLLKQQNLLRQMTV